MRAPSGLRPSDVFTPAQLPLGPSNIYSVRSGPEEKLSKFLERNQVPVVYGEYGVGKTSLVKKFFEVTEKEGRLIHIANAGGKCIEDLAASCLELLNYRVERGVTSAQTSGSSKGLDIKVLTGRLDKGQAMEANYELLIREPTDKRLIDILAEAELVIVIDEMHKASTQFRVAVVDMIKAVNTHGLSYPKFVLVGTAHESDELVRIDEGVNRIIKEVEVPLMTTEEAVRIVVPGIFRLGMMMSEDDMFELILVSARVPSIVHSLCLDATETCLKHDREMVSNNDLKAAVSSYMKEHEKRLYNSYMQAVPTTGQKRYRKLVLHAAASVDEEYARMEQITAYVSDALGENVPASALSGPLRELKESHGSPLRDIRKVEGGTVRNLTAFRDPMFKFFVRFIGNAENQGFLPAGST
jgi:hypothetical protein